MAPFFNDVAQVIAAIFFKFSILIAKPASLFFQPSKRMV